MANRRFEVHEYRNVLVRMRLGDSDCEIAKARLMGRRKAAVFRHVAAEQGWLDTGHPLPEDDEAIGERPVFPVKFGATTINALAMLRETGEISFIGAIGFAKG